MNVWDFLILLHAAVAFVGGIESVIRRQVFTISGFIFLRKRLVFEGTTAVFFGIIEVGTGFLLAVNALFVPNHMQFSGNTFSLLNIIVLYLVGSYLTYFMILIVKE